MTDLADLRALFINTSLTRDVVHSHTGLLLDASAAIMNKKGVSVEHVHFVAHPSPPGTSPDMTEHGWPKDEWPAIWGKSQSGGHLDRWHADLARRGTLGLPHPDRAPLRDVR